MQNFKAFIQSGQGKDILTVLIVIFVGLGSFGLGRLSKGSGEPGIRVEYPPELNPASVQLVGQPAAAAQAVKSAHTKTSGAFFASNRGSKYYPADCSAGQNLKMENRVYFDTREQAESAGYSLSSSCR